MAKNFRMMSLFTDSPYAAKFSKREERSVECRVKNKTIQDDSL